MGGALAYGFIVGDFWEDGGELMDNPWGIVSLFDVYVGFFFFIGWIWYRECCPGMTLIWAIAICVGGNVVAGIYAIIALYKSEGDPEVFFMGNDRRPCSTKEKKAYLFKSLLSAVFPTVIARAKPVAIHWFTKSELHSQIYPIITHLTIRLNI
jgi:hypothetical protein